MKEVRRDVNSTETPRDQYRPAPRLARAALFGRRVARACAPGRRLLLTLPDGTPRIFLPFGWPWEGSKHRVMNNTLTVYFFWTCQSLHFLSKTLFSEVINIRVSSEVARIAFWLGLSWILSVRARRKSVRFRESGLRGERARLSVDYCCPICCFSALSHFHLLPRPLSFSNTSGKAVAMCVCGAKITRVPSVDPFTLP